MAKFRRVPKSAGVWAVGVAVWDIWRRIPPRHRKRILKQARKHGPRLARNAFRATRRH